MLTPLRTLANFLRDLLGSRLSMQIEILALRYQLAVYQRTTARPRIRPIDRLLWSWHSRPWSLWREILVFVRSETVIAWRRRKFREHPTKLSRRGKPGRPPVSREVRDLLRRMSSTRPFWGSPPIVGELQKIGIDLAQSTVERYMVRSRKPPSATWRAFLERRIGSIRRECLDHVIVMSEKHLKRTLGSYLRDYQGWRTPRSLEMDCPQPREVHSADRGGVIEVPEVSGLHHPYERVAA